MSTPDILDVGRGARVSLNLAAQADDDAIIEEEVVEVEEEVIEEEVAEEAEVEEAEVELHIEQETVIDIPVDELASHLLTLPGFIQQVADLVAQSIGAGQQQAASAPQIRFVRSQPQRPTIAANLNGAAAPARPAKKAEPEAPAKKNTVSGFVITSV